MTWRKTLAAAGILASLTMGIPPACTGCMEYQWGYRPDLFPYDYQTTGVTPGGIAYDGQIESERLDRQTEEVERCLERTIPRGSFVVKVAADWVPSCDHSQQLLPPVVAPFGCEAKGEVPTDACPCRYRAGIICPNVLVVTPSAYLFKDVLIRFTLGIDNPWADPHTATCATPTVTPT